MLQQEIDENHPDLLETVNAQGKKDGGLLRVLTGHISFIKKPSSTDIYENITNPQYSGCELCNRKKVDEN